MEVRRRILVVDDAPAILKVLRIKLKLSGYDVITTTSGAEAIELVKSRNPDLVLLDMLLPDVNGLEVLGQVRTFSRVPVIAFSAKLDAGPAAMEKGADAFITKPFDPDLIVSKIKALLNHDS